MSDTTQHTPADVRERVLTVLTAIEWAAKGDHPNGGWYACCPWCAGGDPDDAETPPGRAGHADLCEVAAVLALLRTPRGERPAGPLDAAEWADLDEAVPLPEPLTDAERAEGLARIRADRMRRTPGGEGEPAAVRRTWELAVRRAYGCLDYCGGYHGAELEAFHSGIKTVIRALEVGMDTVDTQTAVLDRIGAARRGEGGGE